MHPLATLPLLIPLTAAHGHLADVFADSKWYTGWNPAFKYENPIPPTVGWQANNLDDGFVAPDSFATQDIICHKSGKSNGAYVLVNAGSNITFHWNTWPLSHRGPIFNYIADCKGDCGAISPTSLRWTKIDEAAWISGNDPGTWVTDDFIKSNFSATTTIPSSLKEGNYVLRHEIIALHAAGQPNGAQAYPQCVNLKVVGNGTMGLSGGVLATSFYKATDPGILFDVYSAFENYTIPGPPVGKFAKRDAESR